ncbi:hypothetical protein ABIB68_001175 [Bradyrhizobium sp. F1.2.2]
MSSVIEQVKPFSVKRAALAATVGNMLEFYDFTTYSIFAIQIGHTSSRREASTAARCRRWRPSAPAS